MGRLCYPTQFRPNNGPVFWQKISFGRKRRVWRTFCRPGTNFIEHYVCRGTSLIGAGKLSRYKILIGGTGAVSRYKLSRSQKFITVQDFNCVQMRVSGCKNQYKFVLSAGAKAKSVTNNLPILSVLGFRAVIFIFFLNLFPFLMCQSIGSSTGSVTHFKTKIMI